MTPSFFPDPEPVPEPEHWVAPPWLQAPEDEYPHRVLVRKFLAQTDRTSLMVSHVDVYSTGTMFAVEWELRRIDESPVDWQLASDLGHLHGALREAGSELRFGLALADGSVVTTVDRYRSPYINHQRPETWSLVHHPGGGGGDERRNSGSSRLWLWPLPPPGPIDLVAEWRQHDIAESRIALDGGPLLAGVARVRSLWS